MLDDLAALRARNVGDLQDHRRYVARCRVVAYLLLDPVDQRGIQTIGLGVDAENPTGATRLYLKAGMHAATEFATYEKELQRLPVDPE